MNEYLANLDYKHLIIEESPYWYFLAWIILNLIQIDDNFYLCDTIFPKTDVTQMVSNLVFCNFDRNKKWRNIHINSSL